MFKADGNASVLPNVFGRKMEPGSNLDSKII
jgi:hypothetical protein